MELIKLTVRIPKSLRLKLERERKRQSREHGYQVTMQELVTRKLNQ